MLFGLTSPLFASTAYDDGYRIGYAIGYVLGSLLCPGLIFVLLFCFRWVRHPLLCLFWALGLVVGIAILLLEILCLMLHPEVLEPSPDALGQAQAIQQSQSAQESRAAGPCYLLLTVPEDADVFVQGTRTTQQGTTREFVSPPLEPGSTYRYKVSVRYRDARGQLVEEARELSVRANSRLRLDFTRPRQ